MAPVLPGALLFLSRAERSKACEPLQPVRETKIQQLANRLEILIVDFRFDLTLQPLLCRNAVDLIPYGLKIGRFGSPPRLHWYLHKWERMFRVQALACPGSLKAGLKTGEPEKRPNLQEGSTQALERLESNRRLVEKCVVDQPGPSNKYCQRQQDIRRNLGHG